MKLNSTILGRFFVASAKIAVTDPTYSPETWCQAILDAAGGHWSAAVLEKDGAAYAFQAVHEYYETPEEKNWELLSGVEIGIDSGVVGFYDAAKYLTPWSLSEDPVSELKKVHDDGGKDVGSLGRIFSRGAACKPGVNNDNFNLYIVKDGEAVVGLRIKFVY